MSTDTFYIESRIIGESFPENQILVEERADGFWIPEFHALVSKRAVGDYHDIRVRHASGWILRTMNELPYDEPTVRRQDILPVFYTIVQMERHPTTRLYHQLWLTRIHRLGHLEWSLVYDYIHNNYRADWLKDSDFQARRTIAMLAREARRGVSLMDKLPSELLRLLLTFLTYD